MLTCVRTDAPDQPCWNSFSAWTKLQSSFWKIEKSVINLSCTPSRPYSTKEKCQDDQMDRHRGVETVNDDALSTDLQDNVNIGVLNAGNHQETLDTLENIKKMWDGIGPKWYCQTPHQTDSTIRTPRLLLRILQQTGSTRILEGGSRQIAFARALYCLHRQNGDCASHFLRRRTFRYQSVSITES